MTLFSTVHSDSSYATTVLWALERAKKGFATGGKDHAFTNFYLVLEQMKYESRYEPPRDTSQASIDLSGDGLEYRKPVWGILQETAMRKAQRPDMSQKECAELLQELISQFLKYSLIKLKVSSLSRDLFEGGVSLSINGVLPEAPVKITIDEDQVNACVEVILEQIVDELTQKITQHIEAN